MAVDNFEIIKPLLTFQDENDFYYLQILQRKKDHPKGTIVGSNNSSRLIKSYNIFSTEQLDKYEKEIKLMCQLFEARAGINLNKRNSKKLALKVISDTARYIECNHTNAMQGLWNEVCGQYSQATDKRWIIDIDEEDLINIVDIVEIIYDSAPNGHPKIIAKIPSKSGIHLITSAFDLRKLKEKYPHIDIQKNNPTNLFIY